MLKWVEVVERRVFYGYFRIIGWIASDPAAAKRRDCLDKESDGCGAGSKPSDDQYDPTVGGSRSPSDVRA